MSKQKESVYIQDWMKFHPASKQTHSDSYYLGLCKEIYVLFQNEEYESLLYGLDNDDLKDFASYLTCYFEDVISKIGIWQAFTSAHNDLYKKYLPFYKLDEYYPDEINPQDIQFLIWYFISGKFLDEYLSPLNIELVNLGLEVYEIFDREFETAPENVKLKTFLSIPENEKDYNKIRIAIDWIFIYSYLFHFQADDLEQEIQSIIDSKDELLLTNIEAIADDMRDFISINQSSNLLAYRGNFWMARILGKKHPLYDEILNLKKRKSGYFIYLKEDNQDIHFQHVASGKELKVTKKSIRALAEFNKESNLFYLNLIKWFDEWWISGSYRIFEYDAKIVKEEKESEESIALFEDDSVSKIQEIENQHKLFLEFNKNKHIAFFNNGQEMQAFLNSFVQFYNKSQLKSKSDSISNTNETENLFKGVVDTEKLPENYKDSDCILFFDKTIGIQIYFGLTGLIPDELNPLYNPENKGDLMDFIFPSSYSPNFVYYLIENYPKMLDEYEAKTGETFVRENIDFLLRFWKFERFD